MGHLFVGVPAAVIRKKGDRPEAADHNSSRMRNQRWIDFLRSTTLGLDGCKALGPVVNTDAKLLIYALFQEGGVLAQDGAARPFVVRFLGLAAPACSCAWTALQSSGAMIDGCWPS